MFDTGDAEGEALLARDPKPGWLAGTRIVEVDGVDQYRPMWDLVDGLPVIDPDLPRPSFEDAWEHAASWFQSELDEAEQYVRVMDVARTGKLVAAYRTALLDLTARYGAEQGHRGSLGVQLFFKQTGLALGVRPGQVAHRVDTALLLEERLPRTWDAYLRRATTWAAVDLAAARAEGLDPEKDAAYDEAAARAVVATPIGSLKRKLRTIREQVQRETADQRAKRTHERRTTTVEGSDDGEASLTITGPAEVIMGIDDALHRAAVAAHGCEGETRTLAQLRFDITCDLIVEGIKHPVAEGADATVPQRKGIVPTVVVTVPVLTLLDRSHEPGRLEGYGPIAPEQARALAAEAPSFFRLLTHPVTGVRMDLDRTTYSPPADLRRWVRLRDETCRWPGCERPAHRCDIDHADEWQHEGVTAAANLVSLCRLDHLMKSTGLVAETVGDDDSVGWPTPWGRTLVDPGPDPFDPAPPGLLDPDCPF